VVIAPGGGHRELVFNAEGADAAKYLQSIGVAAFALKYRLGREEGTPYNIETHARQDGQRAMRLVRSRAAEWGIDPNRIGMMGFSAGGETLWLTAFTETAGDPNAADPIDRVSARPDWIVAVYPGPVGIPQSVPADAPPAFFVVANDDTGAARSIYRVMDLYTEEGAVFEAHLYQRGGHAFNMGRAGFPDSVRAWPTRLTDWMRDNFILSTEGRAEYDKQLAEQRERRARAAERQRQREQERRPQ
jgi:dienelactone hydrolase